YALIDLLRGIDEGVEENPSAQKEVETYLEKQGVSIQKNNQISGNNNIQAGQNSTINSKNTTHQQADKIYNIDKIDKADFS
ncbi:MAG: hypothetical protein AAFU64_01390, partial [Bacteroidota bacterium]